MSDPAHDTYVRIARHAAMNQPEPLVDTLRSVGRPPVNFSAVLRYHHLAPTILATLEEADALDAIDPKLLFAIRSARPKLPSAETLLEAFTEIRTALEGSRIDVVLLKGLFFAERLYGGYHRRPQFDLDMLIHARDRRIAHRTLESLGYARAGYDLHSTTYVRGPLKADVHGWLRRAPAYRINEADVWKGVHAESITGVDVPTLSDEYALVLLGVSCFEDLGQGMIKLKSLTDLVLLLRQIDALTEWDTFWQRRRLERIDGIVAHVFAIAVALLEAESEVPRLHAGLCARGDVAHQVTRELALALTFAPRKHAANLAWFGSVYPGAMWRYLTWFWLGGFPANLSQLQSGRVLATVRAAFKSAPPAAGG